MTSTLASVSLVEPKATALVLLNRPTRPGVVNDSLYEDDRWDLTPGFFEAHVQTNSINWRSFPLSFRGGCKRYIWHLVNFDSTADIANSRARPSLSTVISAKPMLLTFVLSLEDRGRRTIGEATEADLDAWVEAVRSSERTLTDQRHQLSMVKRLWEARQWLPPEIRLPEGVPWNGQEPAALIGYEKRTGNTTPRIGEVTMAYLLTWSLRFVEDFSDHILEVLNVKRSQETATRFIERRNVLGDVPPEPLVVPPTGRTKEQSRASYESVLEYYTRLQLPLPGNITADGWKVDARQVARTLKWQAPAPAQVVRLLEQSGHSRSAYSQIVSDIGPVDAGGEPWLHLTYANVDRLAGLLTTACLIVITYLSGMRPGEVLNLRRGCVDHDGELRAIFGRTFKGVRDHAGEKIPEGKTREVPWIVCAPVASAVAVLERLNDTTLLFPASAFRQAERGPRAITGYTAGVALNRFVEWVNGYCAKRSRPDTIPKDPYRLNLSRFRRTLAWHITRRPRGLVAASIQYGHVFTEITQGYGGTLESGFPDDYAFERFLGRMEDLSEAGERLTHGEQVSGPAADQYRKRVGGAAVRFEGITVRTGKEARVILSNPDLQIYHGRGLSCVYNKDRAQCRIRRETQELSTPNISDCRRGCANIARTDTDIVEVAEMASRLRKVVDDTLAPPIRHRREAAELERLERILNEHAATRGTDE